MLRERMGSIMKCLKKSAVFCLMVILGAGLTACGGDKKEKEEEKVLFDSVKFPETLFDAETAFEDISFDDIDGDGETDVTIDFHHDDDTDTYMVWIWDPEERYGVCY